ncbi:MAG: hypothetical protein WA418_14510 [Bradyrhizobium sp.]
MDIIDPPPASWKISREAWASTPEVIRIEALRAVKELVAGFEKYRSAADRDAELADFHQMAKAGGTTVKEALRKYITTESLIRTDPVEGIRRLAAGMGVDLEAMLTEYLNNEPRAALTEHLSGDAA